MPEAPTALATDTTAALEMWRERCKKEEKFRPKSLNAFRLNPKKLWIAVGREQAEVWAWELGGMRSLFVVHAAATLRTTTPPCHRATTPPCHRANNHPSHANHANHANCPTHSHARPSSRTSWSRRG